jgi:hypothetical protein
MLLNSAGARIRRIRSASSRLGERKSDPLGSQETGAPLSFAKRNKRSVADRLFQTGFSQAGRFGIIKCKHQTERGIRVHTGPIGIRLLGQKSLPQ